MAKSKAPQEIAPKSMNSKSEPGKPSAQNTDGNQSAATKSEQLSLGAESAPLESVYVPADLGGDTAPGSENFPAPSVPHVSAPTAAPVPEGERVIELVTGAKGTWKKLASGKKVKLDDQTWQLELGRMLLKRAPAESTLVEPADPS